MTWLLRDRVKNYVTRDTSKLCDCSVIDSRTCTVRDSIHSKKIVHGFFVQTSLVSTRPDSVVETFE